MITTIGRQAAVLAVRGLLILGPLLALSLVAGPDRGSADAADPADQAITEFLSATGAACYVYGTTTFDPAWLADVLDEATKAPADVDQWIVKDEAWLGSASHAALAFQAPTIAAGAGAQWVLRLDTKEPRAIELRRFEADGRDVWVNADFVAPADCKDNEF